MATENVLIYLRVFYMRLTFFVEESLLYSLRRHKNIETKTKITLLLSITQRINVIGF